MLTLDELNLDADKGAPEMAEQAQEWCTRTLRSAGLTPEQAGKMTLEVGDHQYSTPAGYTWRPSPEEC